MHISKMKWQIFSLVASLMFLVGISHYPYERKPNRELKAQQKTMQSTNLITLNFELKTDPSNLNVSNHMANISKGNQNIAAIISASICLTFKITTGFFFYRSIFYRAYQTLTCMFVKSRFSKKSFKKFAKFAYQMANFTIFLENILLLKNNNFRSIYSFCIRTNSIDPNL